MNFVIRPVEERDLPACIELLRGHLAYPASILPELPKVWRRLLREDALVAAVAESRSLDGKPGSILAFGMVVFVTDAWMAAARTSEEPYLSMKTVRRELTGPSPILRPAAIRHANHESGLNALHLHYAEVCSSEELRSALEYTMQLAFIEYMRGYRVQGNPAAQSLWSGKTPVF